MTKLNEVQNHLYYIYDRSCVIFYSLLWRCKQNVREGPHIKFTVGLYAEV